MKITITNRDLAAILAGLRLLQQVDQQCGGDLPADIRAILDNKGALTPLDSEDIDELFDRIKSETA